MTHDVHLTLDQLRAAIRGLTDTAELRPQDAVQIHRRDARDIHEIAGLSENERQTLALLLETYVRGCLIEQQDPAHGWLPTAVAA